MKSKDQLMTYEGEKSHAEGAPILLRPRPLRRPPSSTTLPISYPVDSNAIQTTATYQANATISAVVNRFFVERGREHSIEIKIQNSQNFRIQAKIMTMTK